MKKLLVWFAILVLGILPVLNAQATTTFTGFDNGVVWGMSVEMVKALEDGEFIYDQYVDEDETLYGIEYKTEISKYVAHKMYFFINDKLFAVFYTQLSIDDVIDDNAHTYLEKALTHIYGKPNDINWEQVSQYFESHNSSELFTTLLTFIDTDSQYGSQVWSSNKTNICLFELINVEDSSGTWLLYYDTSVDFIEEMSCNTSGL